MGNRGFHAACAAAAERWEVPALAIGASVGGARSYAAVGCAQGTRFLVASITKPFTATLALGLLDLHAATGVWPDDVRLRHLLSHTSGFDREDGDLARFGDGDEALGAAVAELRSVPRTVPLEAVWSYSNAGYWIAGWLCAEAAGTTYEEALAARVLRGLEATSFEPPDVRGTGPHAVQDPYPRPRRPSGGLVSNVDDLLSFAERQLADVATAALRRPAARPAGGVYGLGFFGERVGGVAVWGHPGSYDGFQSSLLLVPARNAAFVGLTNSGRGSHALRELEDAWFESVTGARRRVPETFVLSRAELASFRGTYENADLHATLAVGGDGLEVELVEERAADPVVVHARPIGPRTFEIVDGDWAHSRFDFPLERFARIGGRLAERV